MGKTWKRNKGSDWHDRFEHKKNRFKKFISSKKNKGNRIELDLEPVSSEDAATLNLNTSGIDLGNNVKK